MMLGAPVSWPPSLCIRLNILCHILRAASRCATSLGQGFEDRPQSRLFSSGRIALPEGKVCTSAWNAHIDQQRRSLRRLLAQLLKLDYRDSSGEWVRLKVPCEQSLIRFDDGSIGASVADQVRMIGTARRENRT